MFLNMYLAKIGSVVFECFCDSTFTKRCYDTDRMTMQYIVKLLRIKDSAINSYAGTIGINRSCLDKPGCMVTQAIDLLLYITF